MGLLRSRSRAERITTVAAPATRTEAALWREGFGKVATRCVQILAVLAVGSIVVFALTRVGIVLIPVMIALILACAIYPFVNWMRRYMPSIAATWLALLAVIVVIGGLVLLIVWTVRNQWDDLASSATDGVHQLQKYLEQLPFSIDTSQISSLEKTVTDFLTSAQFGRGALAGVSAAAEGVTGVFLTIVVLFFFMKDGPKIWEFMKRPFEGIAYERATRVGNKTVRVLGGYVRGTATIAAVDAIGIGIGLAVVGVPLALPLSVIVFLTAFVPIVGAVLAGALAALVALVANGPVAAIVVIAIVIAVNQLESHFLQPFIMGHSLRLHALVILLSLAAGAAIAGITGAVLAVPIAATAWGIVGVWNGEDEPAWPAKQKRPEVV